jgi:hypothetical protein
METDGDEFGMNSWPENWPGKYEVDVTWTADATGTLSTA